jgi:hypothetical protein
MMSKDLYFVERVPSGSYLYRRVNMRDEVLSTDGTWNRTGKLADWMIGEANSLDQINKVEFDRLLLAAEPRTSPVTCWMTPPEPVGRLAQAMPGCSKPMSIERAPLRFLVGARCWFCS